MTLFIVQSLILGVAQKLNLYLDIVDQLLIPVSFLGDCDKYLGEIRQYKLTEQR